MEILDPDFREKVFCFSLLSMMLVVGFNRALYQVEEAPFYSLFKEYFN